MNWKTLTKTAKRTLSRNGSKILLGFGIAGAFTAVGFAITATPKAMILLDEKKKELGVEKLDIQKVASAFLAEDLSTVKERIINDYAIPMLKNGIWSIFSSALSLMIFGEDRSRSQSSNYVRGSSNSYDRYYANPNRSQPVNQRVIPNWQNLTSDSRADMEGILDQMWEAIREYGQVSIGDLYDLAGMTCNFTDNKYGWKDLTGAYIKNVPGGYSIVFPKPVPLT